MSSHRSLFGKTVAKKPKLDSEAKQGDTSLGSSETNIASTSARKPAFNPALLNSAFYTGPVSYGGAGISSASSPYNQYATSKFYEKKKIDVKVIPSKAESSVGQIAKTICECLESYSSPISDAKRVPVNSRPPFSAHGRTLHSLSMFDTSRRSILNDSLTPNRPHKSRELQIPSIAALSKIKKTNRCSNAAIIASMSSSLPCEPKTYKLRSEEDTSTYKSKIKTKINVVRGAKSEGEEMARPVNLQNISLNITSLPTFSESAFALTSTTKYTASDKKDITSLVSAANVIAPENNFKFTAPTHVKPLEIKKSVGKFSFSDPVDIFDPKHFGRLSKDELESIEKVKKTVKDGTRHNQTPTVASIKFSDPDTASIFGKFRAGNPKLCPKTKDSPLTESWNGIDSKKKNNEKGLLVNGDISHSELSKRSHSEISESTLGDSDENANIKKLKSSASPVGPNNFDSLIKKQQQQWECSSCMTRNDQSKDKCVCCEASKPGASVAAKPTPPATFSGFDEFMKKQQAQWECSGCMTRNDQNKEKCVCCEAQKPGLPVSNPNTTSSFSGFGDFMKKQQSQWECSSCMTRNDQNKDKCVCCEVSKPGAAASSLSTTFASSPSGLSSFVKKQQDQWECPTCMLRNDQNRNKCVCCEASKPGSEPAAAANTKFNFGSTQNTFKFGIDKTNDAAKTTTSDSKTETNTLVTSASVTSFTFGTPTTTDNKTGNGSIGGFKFGIPSSATTTVQSTITTPNSTLTFGDKVENKSIAPIGGFTFQIKPQESANSTAISTTDTKPTFSFGVPQKSTDTKLKSDTSSIIPKVSDAKDSQQVVPVVQKSDDPKVSTLTTAPSDTKPLFSFGAQSKSEFAPKTFQFGAPTSSPMPSTDTFTPSKPFAFSSSTTETKKDSDSASKPAPVFQLPSSSSGNVFSTNTTTGQSVDAKSPATLPALQFSMTPSADKPKDQPLPSIFSFGSAASSETSTGSTFKTPASSVPSFQFGSGNTSKPETTSMFNPPAATTAPTFFGSKPPSEPTLTSPSASLFKPPSTSAPAFGSSPAPNIFKAASDSAPSTNVFGSNALSQTVPKAPTGLFGSAESNAPSVQSTTSPFSTNVPSFGSSNIFGNPTPSTAVNSIPGGMFGASINKPAESTGNMFNPQPPATNIFASTATSPQTSNPIFGSSPAVPTPVFGASIPFGEASQNQPRPNAPFKFGSTSTQPPAMGFGSAPAPGNSAPVFSFGSGSAAPPTNSQFNFSMGTPASAFSTPGLPGARRFKKAVRRNNIR